MPVKTLHQEDLDKLLGQTRKTATIQCRMLRPLAGGVPASEKALKAFVEHHLGIPPESSEFGKALERIQKEEIGERDTTPEGGEVQTEDVYQVNVLRSNGHGPFILEHQLKALLKQAASRLGIFAAKGKRGSKGDLAECSTISAHDASLDEENPWNILLVNKDGEPAQTCFEIISGRVNTPKGWKSIQHHTEIAPAGSLFAFRLDWMPTKLSGNDIIDIIAMATQIGIGSCLSLGYGRFEVVEMEVG